MTKFRFSRAAMLEIAMALAARGLHVFPCRPRDKRPATPNGLKDATTDRDTIARWWRREPDYNIAVATGPVSGVFVIDIDGLDAEGALRKLEAEHGALPPSVEVITARGRHIYFQWPGQPMRNSASKIAPGVDVRGDGGYVLAPPSIHPSGRRYAWSVDSARAFARAPDWVLDKLVAPADGNASIRATPPGSWVELIRGGVDEGQRNDSVARLAGHLLHRHVDPLVTLEIVAAFNDARCRPPLAAVEVSSIVDSICAREMKRRLA